MSSVVLLVDDEPNILYALARGLRNQPFMVYTARSAAAAQHIVNSRPVDVVVCDEHMPGMRGSDLLAWIAEYYPTIPRIVLTGLPTMETALHAINEGRVFRFLIKPCDIGELAFVIREAIESKPLMPLAEP